MSMNIRRERLMEGAARAEGLVVVIDVIRAFTTAAHALAAGGREVVLFDGADEARAAKAREPEAFLMGEVGGAPPAGFDHGNSPSLLPGHLVRGRRVLQRTGFGTRCVLAATRAREVWASSLVVASATARVVRAALAREPGLPVTFVESGGAPEGDDAVADLLEALVRGERPDVAAIVARVRASEAAHEITGRARPHSPPDDIDRCVAVDAFDFALRVTRDGDAVIVRAAPTPPR